MRLFSSLKDRTKKSRGFWHKTALGAVFLLITGGALLSFADAPSAHAAVMDGVVAYSNEALTTLVLWLASIINWITGSIGQMLLVLIDMLIVPILNYNNFATSHVIDLGWSLVRDVVNMFVVVILIIIAMGTIVGYSKVNWQQNLPQFLIAVILVNFSRTICGILIDISQVIMFTFVNALLDVAAGNFAQLLGLQDYGLYSEQALAVASHTESGKAITAFEQLGAAYMLFVLYAAMFAIILLLALVFLYRIIVLWILVILSPLAFFLGGIKSISGAASGANSQWWSKFTAALTLGPMLTFFLWLALASAASGGIAQGFAPSQEPATFVLTQFQSDRLLGVLLGLLFLVVGMQQAAASANSLGGIASQYINEKMGKRLISGAARLPLRGAYIAGTGVGIGAAELGRQADRRLGGRIEGGTGSLSGTIARDIGRQAPKLAAVPFVGGALARGAINATGSVQGSFEHAQVAEMKAAKERVGKYTDDQLAEHVKLISSKGYSPLSLDTREDIDAIKIRALQNGDLRKQLKKDLPKEQYDEFMRKSLELDESKIKAAGGDMDKVNKAKSQEARLLSDKEREKFILSDKFNARDMSEDTAADSEVRKALKKKYIRTDNNGVDIFADDELMKGAYGESLRRAAVAGAGTVEVYDEDTAKEKRDKGDKVGSLRQAYQDVKTGPARPFSQQEIAAGLMAGRIKTKNISEEDFAGPNGNALTLALLQTSHSPDRISDDKARAEYENRLKALPANSLTPTQTVQVDLVRIKDAAGSTPAGVPVDVNFLVTTKKDEAGNDVTDASRIVRVLERDKEQFRNMGSFATGSDERSMAAQAAVIESVKREDIRSMWQRYKTSIDPEEQKVLKQDIEVISRILDKFRENGGTLDKQSGNILKDIRKAAENMDVRPPKRSKDFASGDSDDADGGGKKKRKRGGSGSGGGTPPATPATPTTP